MGRQQNRTGVDEGSPKSERQPVITGRPGRRTCGLRKRIDYRGTTVIGQRMPGARLIRASAVTREQSRDSARAT